MRENLHLIDGTTDYMATTIGCLVSTTGTIQLPRQNRVVGGLLQGRERN